MCFERPTDLENVPSLSDDGSFKFTVWLCVNYSHSLFTHIGIYP
jgi:hypothetical protein